MLVAAVLALAAFWRLRSTNLVFAAHHRKGTDQDTIDAAAHVDHAPAPVDSHDDDVGADRKVHGQNQAAGSRLQPAGHVRPEAPYRLTPVARGPQPDITAAAP